MLALIKEKVSFLKYTLSVQIAVKGLIDFNSVNFGLPEKRTLF